MVPFEPGRTVEVSRKQWAYFSKKPTEKKKAPSERSIFGLPILSPTSLWVTIWSVIISIVDLTYTSFFVALSIAFDNIVPGSSWTWLTYTDCAGTFFYLVDILLEFHTGFIVKYDVHRIVIMNGRDVAKQYVFQGNLNGFWVDLASTLAIIPEILGSALPGISGGGYKAFYLFRLLRLFRVARLLKAAWGVSFLSSPISRALFRKINTATFYLINLLFFLAVFLNLMACLWWFIAELEGLEDSWVAQTSFSVDLLTEGAPARYLTSLYFAITVITTVGFGDIAAFTLPEMALAGVYMLCSLFYFGYIVNVIGTLLSEVSARARSTANLRKKLEDTELWMAERRIPPDLQHEIRRFYFELWAPHGGGILDAAYFLELPVVLRGRIVARLAGDAIRGSKMLGKLHPEVQAHLAEGAVPQRLLAGHNLCEEGDLADKFWVLQEGKVKFYRGIHVTGELHAPAVIGQAAVFAPWISDCQVRMHTVRGVSSCSLWEFSGRPLQKVAKHNPSVLIVLCESYLQYLAGVEQRQYQQRDQQPRRGGWPTASKIVARIKKKVQKMLDKAKESEKEHNREGEEKEPSPPPSPAPKVSAARVLYPQQTRITTKRTGPPNLSRESEAAVMEDEQLPGGDDEESKGESCSGGRGGSGGRELEELVIHEAEEESDNTHSDVASTASTSYLQ
jgi:CRP-like cAMP-binding protein